MLHNYAVNEDNLVYQIDREPFDYTPDYAVVRYDTYGELNERMSHLRLGYLAGVLGHMPGSLIDVGYGNGAFLRTASKVIPNTMGYDVSGYPIPEGSTFEANWLSRMVDVVAMFDVLEHFDDPYILKYCQANYIVLSTPWCHYNELAAQGTDDYASAWFENWKHRRPNEHLWFFDAQSITKFAHKIGASVMDISSIEDVIRTPVANRPNILSAVLRKG
jgi:Methyltransferase domain